MRYKAYTRKYDKVVRADALMSVKALKEQAEVFHKLCPVQDFEPLRERLATIPPPPVSTVVSILIDNSGSMRGAPIAHALGAAGIIAMYLERLGVPHEILGFTTRSWKGGKPREQWIEAGMPKNPGRLNEVRHIVYKDTTESFIDIRHNLALMMVFGVLKENIDGEAVEWAVRRLRKHDAERKILLVISDGAPVDDATQEANLPEDYDPNKDLLSQQREKGYLVQHLRQVIKRLNKAKDIHLDAIGILHDVSALYGVGDRIETMDQLAPVAIAKLEAMLR